MPVYPGAQWVLSVPDHASRGARLRPYLHQSPEVASAVLGIFIRALRSTLRRTGPTAPAVCEIAAISFPQRFGSSLNPHYHSTSLPWMVW